MASPFKQGFRLIFSIYEPLPVFDMAPCFTSRVSFKLFLHVGPRGFLNTKDLITSSSELGEVGVPKLFTFLHPFLFVVRFYLCFLCLGHEDGCPPRTSEARHGARGRFPPGRPGRHN